MEDIVKVNSNPEFQAFMTYEEDQEKIHNSRMRAATEKGLEQGLQQGKRENSIEIAKKLKDDGFDIDKIIEYTSLSQEEIESL